MNGTWILFVVYFFMVFTDAWGDAEKDKGNQKLSHILQSAMIFLCLCLVFVYSELSGLSGWLDAIVILFGGYVMTRWMFIDLFYNLFRKLPMDYIGTSSFYDILQGKILKGWFKRTPPHGILFAKFIIWSAYVGTIVFGNYWKWTGRL